jgi:hypothetical protein
MDLTNRVKMIPLKLPFKLVSGLIIQDIFIEYNVITKNKFIQ